MSPGAQWLCLVAIMACLKAAIAQSSKLQYSGFACWIPSKDSSVPNKGLCVGADYYTCSSAPKNFTSAADCCFDLNKGQGVKFTEALSAQCTGLSTMTTPGCYAPETKAKSLDSKVGLCKGLVADECRGRSFQEAFASMDECCSYHRRYNTPNGDFGLDCTNVSSSKYKSIAYTSAMVGSKPLVDTSRSPPLAQPRSPLPDPKVIKGEGFACWLPSTAGSGSTKGLCVGSDTYTCGKAAKGGFKTAEACCTAIYKGSSSSSSSSSSSRKQCGTKSLDLTPGCYVTELKVAGPGSPKPSGLCKGVPANACKGTSSLYNRAFASIDNCCSYYRRYNTPDGTFGLDCAAKSTSRFGPEAYINPFSGAPTVAKSKAGR